MKVNNIEIPQSVLDIAIKRMKSPGSFTAWVICELIAKEMNLSITGDVPYRAADRLIQKQRKLGNIGPSDHLRYRSHYWRWIAK